MHRMSIPWTILLCLICSISGGAEGQNSKSTTSAQIPLIIDDFFVQTQTRIAEYQSGGFDPVQGRLGIRFLQGNWIEGRLRVGSSDFLGIPRWSVKPVQDLSIVDAFLQAHILFGDFSAGQFLLPFGLDAKDENELTFPRTFIFEKGYLPLRDVGVALSSEFDGWYSHFAFHNGEGAGHINADGRVFMTAQWGYKSKEIHAGISALAGRVLPDPNSPSITATGSGIGPLMPLTESRIRAGNAFAAFFNDGFEFDLEATLLQMEHDSGIKNETLDWHADLSQRITPFGNFLFRYEGLDPDSRASNDFISRISTGVEIHSKNRSSRFFVLGIKNNEPGHEVPNDEVRFIWRVNVIDGDIL